MTERFHTKRWAGYVLLIGGIVMAIGGIWYVGEARAFLDTAARTEGMVVALQRERGAKGFDEDHPMVRFVVPETGEPLEFRSRFGVRPSPFAVGQSVVVAYDPADPARARIDSPWTNWFLPVLLGVFGLACVAAGTLTLRQQRRN